MTVTRENDMGARENSLSESVGAEAPKGPKHSSRTRPSRLEAALDARGVAPVLVCLLVSVLVTCLVLVIHVPKFAALSDDFSQALFVNGRFFNTPGYLMPYSMVLFSAPVSWLYSLAPHFPWYAVSLLGLQAVSFAAMFDLARRLKVSASLRVLLLFGLACCEFMAADYLTFSVAAVIVFAAGMSLVLAQGAFMRPERPTAGIVLGYVLIILGFSMRYDTCAAAALLFVPFLVWAIVRNRNAVTMCMAAGVVVALVGSYAAGQVAWRTTPGWEEYIPIQEAASSVCDYPHVSYDDVQRVAPQLSKNDVEMIYEFLFVDGDPFSLETFQALDTVVRTFSMATLKEAVFSRPAFTVLTFGLDALCIVMALLLSVARGLDHSRRRVLLGVCLALLVITFLVFLRARPRLRVVLPLFSATLFALVVGGLNDAGEGASSPRRAIPVAVPVVGALVFLMVAGLVEVGYVRPLQRQLGAEITRRTEDYVDAHPEQTVLFVRSQGTLENYDAFAFDRWDVPENAVFIGGGYEYYTAPWKSFLERRGIDRTHFFAHLVDDRSMVSVSSEHHARMLETYLHEHTGKDVRAERVQSIGRGTQSPDEYFVWRYVSGEGAPDGGRAAGGGGATGTDAADAADAAADAAPEAAPATARDADAA